MQTSTIALCLVAALAVPVVFVAGGCQGGQSGAASAVGDMLGKIDGEWVLDKLGGKDIASMLGQGMKAPNLNFGKDGSVSGFSGVNRLAGSVNPEDLLQGKLDLSRLASTKMAGTPEAMNLESDFLGSLQKVTGFNFDKAGGLNLTQGKEVLMRLVRGGQ
jgi:heat shock protein HslJ